MCDQHPALHFLDQQCVPISFLAFIFLRILQRASNVPRFLPKFKIQLLTLKNLAVVGMEIVPKFIDSESQGTNADWR